MSFVRFFIVVLFLNENPSWKSASPSPDSVHCFLYDLFRAELIAWALFELTNGGLFFSCENWSGESVSSQLGKWHGLIVFL